MKCYCLSIQPVPIFPLKSLCISSSTICKDWVVETNHTNTSKANTRNHIFHGRPTHAELRASATNPKHCPRPTQNSFPSPIPPFHSSVHPAAAASGLSSSSHQAKTHSLNTITIHMYIVYSPKPKSDASSSSCGSTDPAQPARCVSISPSTPRRSLFIYASYALFQKHHRRSTHPQTTRLKSTQRQRAEGTFRTRK